MKSVLAASAFISVLLLIGRMSGFFREILLAARYGSTQNADAVILFLTLPDVMVSLLLAGGFNAALIPALKQKQGPARSVFLKHVALRVVGAFVFVMFVLWMIPLHLSALLAPALTPAEIPGYKMALRISLIALPLVALVGIAGAYLNTVGKFGISNLGVLLFNTILCLWLAIFAGAGTALLGLALAIVFATALRLAIHLPFMVALWRPHTDTTDIIVAANGAFWRKFGAGVLGYSVIISAPIIFRTLFAAGGDGNLALFNFARKLFELPSALIVAPVVLVILPKLSASMVRVDANYEDFYETAYVALKAAFAMACILMAVAVIFAQPITQAIYLRGAMSPQAVAQVQTIGVIFVCSLPFFAIQHVLAAALNAMGRPQVVLRRACVALAFTVAGTLLLQNVDRLEGLPVVAFGYAAFYVVLSGLYLAAFMPSWRVKQRTLRDMVILMSSLLICSAVAFWLDQHWADTLGQWGQLGLASLTGISMLVFNIPLLQALARLRIDRS